MNTMLYDNRLFWVIPGQQSAIRHHNNDRMEVLTWKEDGEVKYRTRTVKPWFFKDVKSMFERQGLA